MVYLNTRWFMIQPSGYMNHEGCLKAIIYFRNASGETAWNNQVILFDGHVPQYDVDSSYLMVSNFSHPFTLKVGESNNYHPNDNGPNASLKLVYTKKKCYRKERFETSKFTLPHISTVIVTMRDK